MLKKVARVQFVLACCMLLSVDAARGAGPPSQLELVQLPKFCWGQYNKSLKGPEFNIHGCGVGMNHYCQALLALKRSDAPGLPEAKRVQELVTAKRGTEYTLSWMRDYPGCPIRSHVEATLIKVNARLQGVR
jgi:hypothetical protein